MNTSGILPSIGMMVVCAAVLLLLTERLRIPAIVAYIFSGLLLGPATGLLSVSHNIEIISEVGILLLLFLVGMELSFEKIKDLGRTVLVVAGVQMLLTAVPGFLISKAFGLTTTTAVFVGVALMFSSTVVAVKQLEQAGETDEIYGRLSIGVLLVQDLMVVLILTVVSALDGGSLNLASVAKGLGAALLGMALVLFVALGPARWVLKRLFNWTSNNQEAAFLWSLAWCFCLVALSESLHLSPEIGAFLAGMAVAQLPYAHHFRRRLNPLTNFFVAIFFITLGIQMQLGDAFEFGALPWVLIVFVMVVKFVIFAKLLPRFGQTQRTSVLTGVSLSQISEFSLIFATLGVSSGLIDPSILALLSLVALITMSLSSFLFSGRESFLRLLAERKLISAEVDRSESGSESGSQKLEGHVVLVGVNSLSLAILDLLKKNDFEVLVLERDAAKLKGLGVRTVLGDAQDPESLVDAQFTSALAVITTLHIESTNELIVFRCKKNGVACVAHAFDKSVIPSLERLGADHLICSRVLSTVAIQDTLRKSGALES